jgi:carbon monoxide dehydrogenase subunit G
MTCLRHQLSINAPIETVWDAIAGDLTAVRHYNPMIASARVLSDQCQGVGAVRECELTPKGFVQERVWEWTPYRVVGLEVTKSDWPIASMRWTTELHPVGSVTRVSQEMNYQLKFGLVGMLMDTLVMRRKLDRNISMLFENLKRYVEAMPQMRC